MAPPALDLAISIAGLSRDADRPWSGPPKRAIGWVASLGARSIQLDATMPGLRARELDRSARRDLAGAIRRADLQLSGLDLWIPARHFTDPAHQERAAAAVVGALGLASDLASLRVAPETPPVSVHLGQSTPAEIVAGLATESDRLGVEIADHAHPVRQDAHLRVGVDPAIVLAAGDDPAGAVTSAGERLAAARLSDASPAGRVPVGSVEGQLDTLAYAVALSVAGHLRPVVVDLRGLGDRQERAARDALDSLAR